MTLRLLYGITVDSSHITTQQLPGISKQARHVHNYPRNKTAPLILLRVMFDDGFTITTDKQYMSVQNNGQDIIKGTRNKKYGMWEVPLATQKSESVTNNVLGKHINQI